MLQKIDLIIDSIYKGDSNTPNIATYTSYKTVKGYKGEDEIAIKHGEVSYKNNTGHSIQSKHNNNHWEKKVNFADVDTCKKLLNKMGKVLHSVG